MSIFGRRGPCGRPGSHPKPAGMESLRPSSAMSLDFELKMEHIVGREAQGRYQHRALSEKVGETGRKAASGRNHSRGPDHLQYDPRDGKIYLIDFGLSFYEKSVEAQGVDVHVYFQTLESTHDQTAGADREPLRPDIPGPIPEQRRS